MKTAQTSQDLLLSIFEKGVAHSTEKLTALSGTDWAIHIISIDVGAGERFRTILARDQRDYLGVSFSSPGERYLVIFSEESGKALLAASANEHPGGISAAKNMERASLAEIANILINGLSGELADRQGMLRIISAPKTMVSKKADLYNAAFGDLPSVAQDSMVNALIHISSPSLAADCTLMLRLDSLNANFLLNTDPDAPLLP